MSDDPFLDLQRMADEPLLEELQPYVVTMPTVGKMVKHPLVNEFLTVPGYVNRLYVAKKEAAAKALQAGEPGHYLWIHERPWRLLKLMELWLEKRLTLESFRELVLQLWMDTELPYQFGELPLELFRISGFVTDNATEWATLEEPLTIYRGGRAKGISWTTDFDKARWFARRFKHKHHRLFTGAIRKEHALAYITDRQEAEVVVPWDKVLITKTERVV